MGSCSCCGSAEEHERWFREKFGGDAAKSVRAPQEVATVETCEGCPEPATKRDVKGVPLCNECYASMMAHDSGRDPAPAVATGEAPGGNWTEHNCSAPAPAKPAPPVEPQGFEVCSYCGQHHPAGMVVHRDRNGDWCEKQVDALRTERDRLREKCDAFREIAAVAETECDDWKQRYEVLHEEVAHLVATRAAAETAVEKLRAEKSELRTQLQHIDEKLDAASQRWPQTVRTLNEALSTFPVGRIWLKQWDDAEARAENAEAERDRLGAVVVGARELMELHDHPNEALRMERKADAWAKLRAALKSGEQK